MDAKDLDHHSCCPRHLRGGRLRLEAASIPLPSLPKATQAWRSVTGQQVLCVDGDRIWIPRPGKVKILGIEHRDSQTWSLRDEGYLKTWKISSQGNALRTEAGDVSEYKRLDSVPADCDFKAVPLGQAREVPRERVDAVSREIHEHMLKDETAMKSGIMGPTSEFVVANKEYLKKLIQEYGWIDLHRFGLEGSGNAIVLAQHSEDLSLMMAILPFVEKDYANVGDESVMLAILYDALQLHLGRKQRYGTQTGRDSQGNPMILPLEDASKVEQFRKEIGLPPLAEYIQLVSEGLYSGKAVRMPRQDE
jgi:hypothetical protein